MPIRLHATAADTSATAANRRQISIDIHPVLYFGF